MPEIDLFGPYTMGSRTLSNRFVMNPMTRSRSNPEGLANALMAEYYSQRASAGLIVTEGTAPSANGKGYTRIPGLWSQEQAESWKQVTSAVHAKGGHIFAQLMHTGRVSHIDNMTPTSEIVAPSSVALLGQMHTDAQGMQNYPVPRAMEEADIHKAKAEFVQAAKNAIDAGFDGVELHGANGYLLEQFLNPGSNLRTDAWGGSVEKRIRFVAEVAQACAQAIGGDKLGIRLSPYGVGSGMVPYPEIDETYMALAAKLAEAGLVYIHVVDHSGMGAPVVSPELKFALRKAWPRTFLLGGSLNLESARNAVNEGRTDLAGMGRAFLANPDLIQRLQKGLPLNPPDPKTFFSPGPQGYTDYSLVKA